MVTEQDKYPIGKFVRPTDVSEQDIDNHISNIQTFPARLKAEVINLSDEQLDTPYREDGWTIRQVVNHVSDSHSNALIRFKLALTEDKPTIKPYMEDRWAELADSKTISIGPALTMIDGIHQRWAVLLKSMSENAFQRKFIHPEHGNEMTLYVTLALYSWHSNHHLAHITTLKKTKNWQ